MMLLLSRALSWFDVAATQIPYHALRGRCLPSSMGASCSGDLGQPATPRQRHQPPGPAGLHCQPCDCLRGPGCLVEAGRGRSRSLDAVSSPACTTHGGRWVCRCSLLALGGLSARAGATCGEGSPVGDGGSGGEEEEEGLGCRPSTHKLGSLCPCGSESLTLHTHAAMPGVGVTWSARTVSCARCFFACLSP